MAKLPKSSTGKDHKVRNVERGSDIVSLSDQRLIFELPRGNLEVVYPKLLLFHEMKRLIVENRDFFTAYKEIRRHKLDMNLVTDISPKIFAEELSNGGFLKSFRKVDDINIILNALEKEIAKDLEYIYNTEELAEIKNGTEAAARAYGGNKVNYICSIIQQAMLKEQDHFILSIVMTYTRHQPSQLEKALELVKTLQKDEDELLDVVVAPHLNPASNLSFYLALKRDRIKKDKLSSKEVLEYLSWVADANHLYEVALATFDLKLAVMVAETTQKDPKEYLPYIETLREIKDDIDRQFKICLDTKRFDQAIKILANGSQEQIQKALSIIKEKKLFMEGLSAFAKQPEYLIKVRELFADDLVLQREYKQAAPYYLANNNIDKCLDCYEKTLDWEAALEIIEPSKTDTFLEHMKKEYLERKLFTEAARIVKRMSKYSKREYVNLLVERGDDFRTLKKIHFRLDDPEDQDILKTVVIPKLELQAEITITNFTKKIQEVQAKKARLATVQDMKRDNTFLTVGLNFTVSWSISSTAESLITSAK